MVGQDFALSPTHVKQQLLKALAPIGRAAHIGALLKAGRYRLSLKPLTAGNTLVAWYDFPRRVSGAKRRPKPVLIAVGRKTFTEAAQAKIAINLTAHGRWLLEHFHRLKLTAECTFTAPGERAIVVTKTFTLTP